MHDTGNGFNTCTIPAWQAETSRAHRRGTLVMISGAFITFGLMMSYWVGFAFAWIDTATSSATYAGSSAAWRVPIAFQIPMMLMVAMVVFFLPESPRWLILNGRAEEALRVLAALDDRSMEDAVVYKEFLAIKDAVIEMGGGGFGSIFSNDEARHGHRTILACLIQGLQQTSGVNLIAQYLPLLILQQAGYTQWVSRLLAGCVGTVAFLAAFVPVVGIDHFWGRRSLMIFGSSGMTIAMIILAIMGEVNNGGAHVVLVIFFFVFMAFFVIGWQGMAWLYSAEIVPLKIRGPANALSTATNWLCNFWVVLITPIAFEAIGYTTYIIFIALNAVSIPLVWLLYPETAYRTLEEVDVFFHAAGTEANPWRAVVRISQETPLWYGRDGNIDFDYEASEWHHRQLAKKKGGDSQGSTGDSQETPTSSDPVSSENRETGSSESYGNGYGGERMLEKEEERDGLMRRTGSDETKVEEGQRQEKENTDAAQQNRRREDMTFNDLAPGARYSERRPGFKGWILREPGKGA